MVQNARAEEKNRGGRPREFDRDQVLQAAVFAFWTAGYRGATVGELEAATGIDRSTLYKSFGGKDGLYASAAETYVSMATEQLFSALHDGSDGVADIVEFVDRLTASYVEGQPRGCLIVNDMSNVAPNAASNRYFELLHDGFRAALERAAEAGEIPPERAQPRVQFLIAALIGVNLTHRNVADPEVALGLLAGIRDEVTSWAG